MEKQQKTILKGIGGFLLITIGLFSDDEFTESMAFSGGAALIISGIVDLLNQDNNTNNLPV